MSGARPASRKEYAIFTEEDLGDDRGEYLRALKEGLYLYIYFTTHSVPSVYLAAEDLPHIPSYLQSTRRHFRCVYADKKKTMTVIYYEQHLLRIAEYSSPS